MAVKFGRATNIRIGGDTRTSWLGRVQKIKRKVSTKWGSCRHPIDILNCSRNASLKTGGPTKMVLLNWFSKPSWNLKFKCDHCDSKWMDVDSIKAIVTLSYATKTCMYKLDNNNANNLNEFVSKKMPEGKAGDMPYL